MGALVSFSSFSDELYKIAERASLSKADLAVYKTLVKGSPVSVRISPEAGEHGGGYFDLTKKEIVLTQKKYDVLAHEVGHAHVDQHILGKMIQSRIARLAFGLSGTLAGIGASILMAKGKKWGLLLPAAIAAPTIVSEALATRKGRQVLEELGVTKTQMAKYKKTTGEGLGTYLTVPLMGTLLGGVLHSLPAVRTTPG
jgi:hypothetical protein